VWSVKKFALGLVVALAVATPAAAAKLPLVPTFIQSRIKQKAGYQAYVPTRAPFRYTYLSYNWYDRDKILLVRLADRRYANRAAHTITFSVHRFRGNCAAGNQKSYQVDGNKTYSDAGVAWRCLPGVKLLASGPNLPEVALAQVVASAKRIR
jgi:hypothetical protein